MIITNKFNLPAGLVKAASTERHNAAGCISATTLLKGVKEIILTDRHYDEIEVDVSDLIWAIFGTAVHSLLESEGENDFTEQKMSYQIGEITVTGRIDNYNMATGTICDYKTASVNKVKFNDYSDWNRQGLIYAWLLNRNKFPANQCRFIALLKDHSKTEAERDHQYPSNPVCVYEFPIKSSEIFKIGAFIRSRVGEYEKYLTAPDDEIPPCSADERWDRPSVFAVKKEGRQRAVKLFDLQGEAEAKAAELGTGHYVEHRKGESVKCAHYCSCAGFCNYYQANVIGIKSALATVKTGESVEKLVA
jgi:hypothetical protein